MVTMPPEGLDRRAVVRKLVDARDGALIVTGLGSPSYDLHAAGDCDANYYLWGAMGGAALVGLGLAQAQPTKRVMVITGDGEQLMGLGGLATIGAAAPRNLDIVVLDNQRYGETGMQPSHTGRGIDLPQVAAACGFAEARSIRTDEELEALRQGLGASASGPRFYAIMISSSPLPRSLPSRDAVLIKNRLRSHLAVAPPVDG